MVDHSSEHKGLGLRSWFFRYSFAKVFLDLGHWRGFPCGNSPIAWSDQRFLGQNGPEHSPDLRVGPSESDRVPNRLEFEQWVPFPPERVFAFFSNPENLPRIMPASSGTRLMVVNRMPPPAPPAGVSGDKAAGVSSTTSPGSASSPSSRFARHGSRGSPNSNGIITVLTSRTRVRSRPGITATSS